MIKRTMDIVIFAMSTWAEWNAGTMNRNAHVVRTLAMHPRVRRVLVVDYLPYDRQRQFRAVLQSFHGAKPRGSIVARGAGWTTYRTQETVAHVVSHIRSTDTMRVQQMVDASAAALGMEHPWYWSYVPFTAGLMNVLHGAGWVYDVVDDWTTHPSYQRL
ncbi:MAG: hypothetical protein HY341_02605, partial [Candidatus Kerfeldbacteria bacterium]|nr:hypothetical protein [Candidatus Kerfeldbacteria bacterium]